MVDNILLEHARRVCARVDFSRLRGATVLVTGASGLVGTHVMACLCEAVEQGTPMSLAIPEVHEIGAKRFNDADRVRQLLPCEMTRPRLVP